MRPQIAASLPVATLLALCSPAVAGPVAAVARGVENKVETHSDSKTSAPPDRGADSHDHTDYYDTSCVNCGTGTVVFVGGDASGSGETLLPGPARVDLYVGAHAVVGSRGALIAEIRASKDWLGISASATSYFDEAEAKGRSDAVRLDLMAFALNARLFGNRATEIWLDGGLGVSSSSEYEPILGTAFGLRAEQRLLPQLALAAQGRLFMLEADVSAWEGWVGVRAGILSAGYRAVEFNVGPPLHGPEAGIALRF